MVDYSWAYYLIFYLYAGFLYSCSFLNFVLFLFLGYCLHSIFWSVLAIVGRKFKRLLAISIWFLYIVKSSFTLMSHYEHYNANAKSMTDLREYICEILADPTQSEMRNNGNNSPKTTKVHCSVLYSMFQNRNTQTCM